MGDEVGFYVHLLGLLVGRCAGLLNGRGLAVSGIQLHVLSWLRCTGHRAALCRVTRLATALWTHRWSDIATEAKKELWL